MVARMSMNCVEDAFASSSRGLEASHARVLVSIASSSTLQSNLLSSDLIYHMDRYQTPINRAWGDCQASSYGTSTTKEKATQSKAKPVVQSLPSIDCPSILLCDMNNHLLLPPGLFSLAHFGSPFARSTAISPSERCLSYCPLIFATTGARSLNNVFWQHRQKGLLYVTGVFFPSFRFGVASSLVH